MPRINVCSRAQNFENALKKKQEIAWRDIVSLDTVVGGEVRFLSDEWCRQGIISAITLENGAVSIMCPWLLETELDEDGDEVGDYMQEVWKVVDNPKLPLTIHVPKSQAVGEDLSMVQTAFGPFAKGEWAVRYSEDTIGFCGGTAFIFLNGFKSSPFRASVRDIAPNFDLQVP